MTALGLEFNDKQLQESLKDHQLSTEVRILRIDMISQDIKTMEKVLFSGIFPEMTKGNLKWNSSRIIYTPEDKPLIETKISVRIKEYENLKKFLTETFD